MGLSPSQVALVTYSSGPVTLSHSLLTQGSPLAPINAGLLLIAGAWLRLRCIISGPIHSGDHRRCVVHQPCSREIMNQRLPSYCYTLGHEGFPNEHSFMNLCVGDDRIREITAIKEYDLIWVIEIVRKKLRSGFPMSHCHDTAHWRAALSWPLTLHVSCSKISINKFSRLWDTFIKGNPFVIQTVERMFIKY